MAIYYDDLLLDVCPQCGISFMINETAQKRVCLNCKYFEVSIPNTIDEQLEELKECQRH